MKILKIDINEFGGLTDLHLDLSEGLNILEGDNEAGKSTIWLFIKSMLYGMPKKSSPEHDKAINRTTHRAFGSMTLCHEGKIYRIERSFTGGTRGKCVCTDENGERVFTDKEPGEAMLSVSRDIFENSCSIGQALCTGLGGEKSAAAIQNILTSADESVNVEKIISKLNKLRVSYRHKNGKGGKLYELECELRELEQRLNIATENHLKIVDTQERLKKNSASLEESERRLDEAKDILTKLDILHILRRFDALKKTRAQLEDREKALEALIEENFSNGYIPSPPELAYLKICISSVEAAEAEAAVYEERLNALSSEKSYDEDIASIGQRLEHEEGSDALLSRLRKMTSLSKAGIALAVLGGIAAVAGIVLFPLLPIGLALSAVGIALAAIYGSKAKGLAAAYGKKPKELAGFISECMSAYAAMQEHEERLRQAINEADTAKDKLNTALTMLKNSLQKLVPQAECNAEAAKAEHSRLVALCSDHISLTSEISQLKLNIKNENEILSSYNEAELREHIALETEKLERIDINGIIKSKELYESKVSTYRDADYKLRNELMGLMSVAGDPSELADKITELKAEYARAEQYYGAIILAINSIEAASETLRENVTPALSRNAGKIMEYISNGRYSTVNMGTELDLSLIDSEGLTTTGEMMSGGTKDAAYLALRISLMLQIYGKELPPLMMDETLCQLDSTRTCKILKLLSEQCTAGMQCLLFTCHDREGQLCQKEAIPARRIYLNTIVGKT